MKNEILLQFFSITIIAKAFGHCYMYLWQYCMNLILDIFFYVQHVPKSFNITRVLQKDACNAWFFNKSVSKTIYCTSLYALTVCKDERYTHPYTGPELNDMFSSGQSGTSST